MLHNDLKKLKICARVVLQALTAKQHNQRVAHVHNMLEKVKNGPEFLYLTACTISNIFAMVKPNLAQNFIATHCSKFSYFKLAYDID